MSNGKEVPFLNISYIALHRFTGPRATWQYSYFVVDSTRIYLTNIRSAEDVMVSSIVSTFTGRPLILDAVDDQKAEIEATIKRYLKRKVQYEAHEDTKLQDIIKSEWLIASENSYIAWLVLQERQQQVKFI